MIRHKKVKMLALVLTFVMLFATAASAASIPNDSVIIGDKGFSIGFLTNPANAAEIQTALDNLGSGFLAYQIEGQTTGWTSIMGDTPLTEADVAAFPAIAYKDDAGVETNYPGGGTVIPDIPVTEASITLKSTPSERQIKPEGVTDPIEIKAKLEKFPANVEATLAFSATWGQISKEETTTNQEVVVKLYPEDTTKDQIVTVRAEVIKARNVVTGEEKNDWKNVDIAPITVKFVVTGGGEQGTLFQVNTAVANQADRVTVLFNEALSKAAVEAMIDNPGAFTVYDNLSILANQVIPAAGNITIPVQAVIKTGEKSIMLVLDRKGANFPLTDNVKHKVVVNYEKAAPFLKIMGSADFFLEDSSYIKLMKVNTRFNKETLDYNQVEVQFSEAVNDLIPAEGPAFANSAANLRNWVIDGLNLATQLPSNAGAILPTNPKVPIVTISTDKENIARETVIITFKDQLDYTEFLKPGTHKLQVNTLGDWASVTDELNIVATQELEYQGVALPPILVEWKMDGKPMVDSINVLADGKDESPEQYVVEFNQPVTDSTAGDSFADNFEIIVPDNNAASPYVNYKWKLVADGSAAPALRTFTVTQLDKKGAKYLIELNNDWTKIYNTAATKENYHDARFNPLRLVVKNFQDLYGRNVEDVLNTKTMIANNHLSLVEDVQSPYTTLKEQLEYLNKNEIPGAVYIEMNEPCQFKDKFSDTWTILTPSQQQEKILGGVDVNTFEYVMVKNALGQVPGSAKTVEGKIAALLTTKTGAIEAKRDYAIKVIPVTPLEAGEWKLVIRAISDDVGNAMATEEMPITIKGAGPVGLICIGIDAHHTVVNDNNPLYLGRTWLPEYTIDLEKVNDAADIIHVLFNKDLKLIGDNSALNKANWRLNGEPLPVDGTRIQRGILGDPNPALQNSKTGVTIILPDGYLQERDDKHVLTMTNIEPEVQVDETDRVTLREQVPYLKMHVGGGGGAPTFTLVVNNGLTPGKKMVIVTLDTANPENYNVAVAGTPLAYNAAQKKFGGEVDEADAVDAKVVVSEKVVEPTPTFTMAVNNGLVPGKKIVIVTLNTTTPENYNVAVAGTPLTYNASAKKFAGEVDEADAVDAKVVVTAK